jgi:uncharacterized protein
MAAVQARALAEAGWTALQIDLFGCGDSAGDFGDATWAHWVADVTAAASWLRMESGSPPVLFGLRTGCLLAAEVARVSDPVPHLAFWQPVISGREYLQQFLRQRVVGQLIGGATEGRIGTKELRDQLLRGESVEVAGYSLSPQLALGLDGAGLELPASEAPIAWFEISGDAGAGLSPAATRRIEILRAAGHRVHSESVNGLPFWQTQEIAECLELVEKTITAVDGWR